MPTRDALLPEFDQEVATTRRTLERVPDGRFDFKPHPKSGSLGWRAGHLAQLPAWTSITLLQSELDMGAPDLPRPTPPADRAGVLALFDRNLAEGRAALAAASDEQLRGPGKLLNDGQEVFTLPRLAVLRSFVLNHMIHHRAQLGVYLRLNDVPVPAVYGPSADEQGM